MSVLIISCYTVVYIVYMQKFAKKNDSEQRPLKLGWSIYTQIVLLVLQALLFSIVDIWDLANGKIDFKTHKRDIPDLYYILFFTAETAFSLQHALFVGQYARVCITVPLIFCIQDRKIIKHRKTKIRCIGYIEILWAMFLSIILTLRVFEWRCGQWVTILWLFQILLLTLLLVLALNRLRKLQKEIAVFFCNERLI